MNESGMNMGRKYLMGLIEKKKLTSWCRGTFGSRFSVVYVYNVAVGKYDFPSLSFIMTAAKEINPALWFYAPGERARRSAGNSKISSYKESQNFKRLCAIKDLWHWSEDNGQNYLTMRLLVDGKRSLTPQRIKALKCCFAPALWFC